MSSTLPFAVVLWQNTNCACGIRSYGLTQCSRACYH